MASKISTFNPVRLVWMLLSLLTIGSFVPATFASGAKSPSMGTGCNPIVDGFVDCSHRGLTEVPSDIPDTVKKLDLSHNKFSSIPVNAFDGLTDLQKLDLSYNTISRKSIVADLFKDLGRLQELYLNHNQVNKFVGNPLENLGKLRILDLSDMNNGIPKPISVDVFQPLKSLIDLRMNNVLLTSFKFLASGSLSKLRNLELARNKVTKVQKGDFDYLKGASIDTLDLSGNALGSIDPGSFGGVQLLKFLNLGRALSSESVISQVGTAIQKVHITNLSLAMVGLTHLENSTFQTFEESNLLSLDLSLNNITAIEDAPFRYLRNLNDLNLYKNNISKIGPDAFDYLVNLRHLNLGNNSLTCLNRTTFQSLNGSVLETLFLKLNLIETIQPGAFLGLGQLKYLKLSNNRIEQEFDGNEFEGMPKLDYLDLALNKEIKLGSYAFKHIQALGKLYLNVVGMKKMEAGTSPFRFLINLQTLDLSNNSLSSIVAPDIFKSLTNLQVLYVQHNNLYHLWEDHPESPINFLDGLQSLQKADLSYNGFQGIPNGTFKHLERLQSLLLAHNKIKELPSSSFEGLSSLSKLQLHYNLLHTITEDSFRPFVESLQSLSISDNPWFCNCDLEWFRKWVNHTDAVITDLDKTFCADLAGKKLLDFWPSPYDCDGVLRPIYYYIMGAASGLIVCLILVLWGCRWRIRYCLLRGKARRRYRKREGYKVLPGRNVEQGFDVFISYSSKDNEWVQNTLKPELTDADEGGEHFEVVDHTELSPIFVAGEPIVENIQRAIDQSRKTLCIISRNYLMSDWCRHEHEVAMFKHLGDKRCLIVIRFKDVTDAELKEHHLIQQVMRQDTYLEWPGEEAAAIQKNVFWERLREAVAKVEQRKCCCC